MKSELILSYSFWLIPLCLCIGAAYAWLLYHRKKTFSKQRNLVLALLRAVTVALICFLLINPLIRTLSTKSLKPVLVIGLDQSQSLQIIGKKSLNQFKSELGKLIDKIDLDKYELAIRDLNGEIINADSLKFSDTKTDYGKFFQAVSDEFEGQNLKKVLLISDGIQNSGLSPLNKPFTFAINTIGLGDSTIKKDLALKGITANKLAYLGNTFPIDIDITASLFQGQSALIQIRDDKNVIGSQSIRISNQDFFQTLHFQFQASEPGKKRFQVEIIPISGESNLRNNRKDVIVEIIDGKEKVLIVSAAPHPDVKALRDILERNELFDVKSCVVDIDDEEIAKSNFDLLILNQLPAKNSSKNRNLSQLLSKLKPTFFILGQQSEINLFNGMQEVLNISGVGQGDLVKANFNSNFKRFPEEAGLNEILTNISPITAIFGDYRLNGNSEIVLYQQVGNVKTDRPLLVLNTSVNRKSAVMAAEGIWKWRLEEYQNTTQQFYLDDLLLKTLQLISMKENKDKLRVYPTQDVLNIDEKVIFQNEAYDDLYRRIEPLSVQLTILGEKNFKKLFKYEANIQQSTFEISNLPQGVYHYLAEGNVLSKKQISKGQFIIQDMDLEYINTTADFNFLRTLANQNEGRFSLWRNAHNLFNELNNEKETARLISSEDLKEMINLKWLLPLLILLVTVEWAARKYFGTY